MSLLCTTVVRNAPQGSIHGGLHLLDFSTLEHRCLLRWDDPDFDFRGRGGDRGLRGFCTYGGFVFVAAADRVLMLDIEGGIVEEIQHPLLGLLHDVKATPSGFAVVSTRYDSVLFFDAHAWRFTRGIHLGRDLRPRLFDPGSETPPDDQYWHLNSVDIGSGSRPRIRVSGLRLKYLVDLTTGDRDAWPPLPLGTHNAQISRHGLAYCDTERDRLMLNVNALRLPQEVPFSQWEGTRSRFMRGLHIADEDIYVGTSPATVYRVYREPLRWGEKIQISDDLHVAIQSIGEGPMALAG